MIEFDQVHHSFHGQDGSEVHALRGLDLQIHQGELHALLGRSGCGKTTALRLINGLLIPSRGTVRVDGVDVAATDLRLLRRKIGYVLQSGGLFPHLSVLDNVALPGRLAGQPLEQRRAAATSALATMHLDPAQVGNRRPQDLSGGQRQRASLARALVLDPPYLLLDEPFSALDPITRRALHDEFLTFRRSGTSCTVVLVTHDVAEAVLLADRITVLRAGMVEQTGTPEELAGAAPGSFVAELMGGRQEQE